MSALLAPCALAAAVLLGVAGVEKCFAAVRRTRGGYFALTPTSIGLGVAETLLAVVIITDLIWPHPSPLGEVGSGYALLVLGLVYLAFAGHSAASGRRHPGASCGCSALLEVPLLRAWSGVTARALVAASFSGGYGIVILLSEAREDMTAWQLLAGPALAVVALVSPYVHSSERRPGADAGRDPVSFTVPREAER